MTSSGFKVTAKAMRPASKAKQCFYCQEPVGGEHEDNCVLILKRVKVSLTIEYEVSVPGHWDRHAIEFQRNDGSWCADNLIEELREFAEEKGCLCPHAHFEFVEDCDNTTCLKEEG